MPLIEFEWRPPDRQVKQFGVICALALPFIAWWWGAENLILAGFAMGGVLMAVGSFVAPAAIRPIFVAAMLIALPIGMVLGTVALTLIYYCVILPLSLLMRLVRRDALHRSLDRDAVTYWQPKKAPKGPASYYRQS